MSYDDAPTVAPDTLDLLGRRWPLGAAVTASCFNRDGSAAAFRAGDGLAVAGPDPEDAAGRIRVAADTGRMTITPRARPVRAPERVDGVAGALGPFGARGFLTGLAAGGLASVTPRGQLTPLGRGFAAPPAAIAADPGSDAVAAAAGAEVIVLRPGGEDDRLAPLAGRDVRALAFGPKGAGLVAATEDGLTLFRPGGGGATRIDLDGGAAALAFSRDGRLLAIALEAGGFAVLRLDDLTLNRFEGFPTPVRALAFGPAALIASGAFRVAAWAARADGLGEPQEAGRAGLVVVERVAAHPAQPLVAAGYASGLVVLTRIGDRGEMMLRAQGGGVTTLAFSPDGARLALADADGEAAVASLPPALFKQGA